MVTPSHVHTFLVFWNSPADRAMIPHMSLGEGRGRGCGRREGMQNAGGGGEGQEGGEKD